MPSWLARAPVFQALVLFPAAEPPRDAIEAALAKAGVLVKIGGPGEAPGAWKLALRHPAWGAATLEPRDPAMPFPKALVELAPGLDRDERAKAVKARSALALAVPGAGGGVLADRKLALRFAAAAMGSTGLAVLDLDSMIAWSPGALADELAHDADLDVEQVHGLHAVGDEKTPIWLHSHGLAALGAYDFDVLDPSRDVLGRTDLLRALAFAILEGKLEPDADRFELVSPGGEIRMVPVETFTARAEPALARGLRDADDPDHNADRSVVCEPARQGFLALLPGSDRVRPASLFQGSIPDTTVVAFSNQASELMAWRARKTLDAMFRRAKELAEFEVVTLVKLGYPTEAGGEESAEHLWFEVHRRHGDEVEATLLNEPFAVPELREGQRGRFPLALLSDWALQTPAGAITPRSARAARILRAHRTEILAEMKANRPS